MRPTFRELLGLLEREASSAVAVVATGGVAAGAFAPTPLKAAPNRGMSGDQAVAGTPPKAPEGERSGAGQLPPPRMPW